MDEVNVPERGGRVVGTDGQRALRRSALFGGLNDERLADLAATAHQETVRRGERVWMRNGSASDVLLVISGRLQTRIEHDGGRRWSQSVLRAGHVCGVTSVVDGGPHTADVFAMERTKLIRIPCNALRSLMAEDHGFALRIAKVLAAQLRHVSVICEQVVLLSPLERLVLLIGSLDERDGWRKLPGTQSDLAAQLGTVREVVGRGLRRLERDGVLRRRGRHVRVVDADAFAQMTG
jgi:CRP/FNR family transcriptional regulator, cyclic AMP receptor protein